MLVFQDGQAEAEISVSVADDEIPEESETLQIELVSTTGNALLKWVVTVAQQCVAIGTCQ